MFQKQRLNNYGLWIAIIALIIDVLVSVGLIPISESEVITSYAQRGLEIFVLLGIVSNPTKPDGKGFNL